MDRAGVQSRANGTQQRPVVRQSLPAPPRPVGRSESVPSADPDPYCPQREPIFNRNQRKCSTAIEAMGRAQRQRPELGLGRCWDGVLLGWGAGWGAGMGSFYGRFGRGAVESRCGSCPISAVTEMGQERRYRDRQLTSGAGTGCSNGTGMGSWERLLEDLLRRVRYQRLKPYIAAQALERLTLIPIGYFSS